MLIVRINTDLSRYNKIEKAFRAKNPHMDDKTVQLYMQAANKSGSPSEMAKNLGLPETTAKLDVNDFN